MDIFPSVKEKVSQKAAWILKHVQRKRPAIGKRIKLPVEGTTEGLNFFLGTKTGLLYFDGECLWRLLEGRVYGLTHANDRWYTTWNYQVSLGGKDLTTVGSILSFRFVEERVEDLRVEAAPLDQELHQIDTWDGHLYVTDTAHNRVLEYRIGPSGISYVRAHYPRGTLSEGKKSDNYAHINSVFQHEGCTYLMYHNHTQYTGRTSQVAVLDDNWRTIRIMNTEADSAHNVFWDGEGIVYCDSKNGRLMRNSKVLLEKEIYLRGLAVTNSSWLLGGSEFAKRNERDSTTGYVYQYDKNVTKKISELKIPNSGSLYEIRIKNKDDYGMSNI
jgi:gamma-glutamylcyclotransferase (GGCT)/AIG2-like uncharacterized protein YtfP